MQRKYSVLEYVSDMTFVPISAMPSKPPSLAECLSQKKYRIIETEIINLLAKHKVLNKYNLVRLLNASKSIPRHLKKPNYDNNVKELVKDGFIESYRLLYKDTQDSDSPLMTYSLTEYACEQLNALLGPRRSYYQTNKDMPEYVLEKLAANQYIASLKASYSKEIARIHPWNEIKLGNISPVVVILKVDKEIYKTDKLKMLALSLPKNDEDQRRFLKSLMDAGRYTRFHSPQDIRTIPVYIVSNTNDMMNVCDALKTWREINIMPYFLLEEDLLHTNPLERLYICRMNLDDGYDIRMTEIALYKKPVIS